VSAFDWRGLMTRVSKSSYIAQLPHCSLRISMFQQQHMSVDLVTRLHRRN